MAGLFLQSDTATRLWLSGQPLRTRQVMALIDTATHQADYGRGADQRQDDGRCRFNVTNLTPEIGRRLLACQASNGPGVLVFGDSHAIDLFGEMASRTPQPFLVGLTQSWCRPHSPSQQCQYEEIMHFVASHPQVFHHAVFEQAGFYLLHNPQHEIGRDILLNFGLKDRVKGIDPDNANIAADVGYLRHLATQVPIVWFGPRLDLMIGRSEMVGRGCDFPYQIRPGLAETYARLDGELAQQAATAPGVTYVSQIRTMHFAVPQDLLDCRRLLWSDTDHYSAAGEVEFGLRLPPLWDLAAVRAVALPPQPDRKRQPRP